MKIFFFLAVCFITMANFFLQKNVANGITDTVTQGMSYDSMLKDLLEKAKNYMRNGYPALKLPVLDPFVLKNKEIHISDKYYGELSNVTVHNLSSFEAKNSSLIVGDDVSFSIDLSWPEIYGEGSFDLNSYIYIFMEPVNGAGNFKFSVDGINVSANAVLEIDSNNKVKFKELQTSLSVGGLKFDIV